MASNPVRTDDQRLLRYLRVLAETDLLLLLCASPDGTIKYASPATESALGIERGNASGMRMHALTRPQDATVLDGLLSDAVAASRLNPGTRVSGQATLEFRSSSRSGGGSFEMDVVAGPSVDSETGETEVVFCLRETGARTQVRHRLRDTEIRLEPAPQGKDFGVIGTPEETTETSHLHERVLRNESRLRSLTARLHAAQEDERKRLAGEVHDVLGQALTALRMDVAWIGEHADGDHPEFEDRLADAMKLIESTIEKVRTMSHELRPGVLDHFGLIAALEWQNDQYEQRSGLTCVLEDLTGGVLGEETEAVPPEMATAVFRIFQEAFTNVVRHADATTVTTRLAVEEHGEHRRLRLEVADDGKGFSGDPLGEDDDSGTATSSLGMLNMRERMLPWGGSVDVTGSPGEGTVVRVLVPLLQSGGGITP